MAEHASWCDWPSGPCDCGAGGMRNNESREEGRRRLSGMHAQWCFYPSDPCSCGDNG